MRRVPQKLTFWQLLSKVDSMSTDNNPNARRFSQAIS